MAKAGRRLDDLTATLASGLTRRPRTQVETEIAKITRDAWVRRVTTWQLTGDKLADLRSTWQVDRDARARPEEEIFGKHVLNHRPRRLAGRRRRRGVPVPVRSGALLPSDEGPPRRVVLRVDRGAMGRQAVQGFDERQDVVDPVLEQVPPDRTPSASRRPTQSEKG